MRWGGLSHVTELELIAALESFCCHLLGLQRAFHCIDIYCSTDYGPLAVSSEPLTSNLLTSFQLARKYLLFLMISCQERVPWRRSKGPNDTVCKCEGGWDVRLLDTASHSPCSRCPLWYPEPAAQMGPICPTFPFLEMVVSPNGLVVSFSIATLRES